MSLKSPSVLHSTALALTICAVLLIGGSASIQRATGSITASITLTVPSSSSAISAVWANDGEDKVTQNEHRATTSPSSVYNTVWPSPGTTIRQFGAKNEVVSFNVVIEAGSVAASKVTVALSNLAGPGGSVIRYARRATSGNSLFDWTSTEGELFYVRYLQIKGLSAFGYTIDDWDERSIPEKMQCAPLPPPGGACTANAWATRPNHGKFYPDIAVPLELVSATGFTIAATQNQSIWADIYIPATAAAGLYTGNFTISENGVATHTVPVKLTVRNFALPDIPSGKTMVNAAFPDDARRYTGNEYPDLNSPAYALTLQVQQNEFLMAHRHKISLIGDGDNNNPMGTQPSDGHIPALTGTLFTVANGYAGPGYNTGNNVYSIGTYGSWQSASWPATQAGFWTNTNAWEQWFENNAPAVDRFVYLCDESGCNLPTTQQWADWMKTNPDVGKNIKSLATVDPATAVNSVPSLSIPTSTFTVGLTATWQDAVTTLEADSSKEYFMYNGARPAEGGFCTDCDGSDLREQQWGAYKKGVVRWFLWDANYYNNYQNGGTDTNLFHVAQTFGAPNPTFDPDFGWKSFNYSNGDGVLFYPGTDAKFPADSYGVAGPIASLRLKHWRRGIQDMDYLTMAAAINPSAVITLVNTMVPQAMWELTVHDINDPTYYWIGPSWNSNPNGWENARLQLAHIIDGQ